ncbi:hypothetical protein ACFFRR_006739 [Megaselia abdita]
MDYSDDLPEDLVLSTRVTVFIVDSFQSLKELKPTTRHTKNSPDTYIIYLKLKFFMKGSYYNEMEKIFRFLLGRNILNVVIVIPELRKVNLVYTYFPFTQYSCYETYPVLIVRYIDGVPDREINFELIFPKKVNNINKCEVTVALFNSTPYLTVNPLKRRITDFEGILLNELSKNMNFSIRFNLQKEGEDSRGTVFENGTANGALEKLIKSEANMSLGCFRCSSERAAVASLTNPHYDTALVMFIFRPPEVYEAIEMLILPFSKNLWTAVIISKAVGTIFILFSYNYHRQFYDFVSPRSYGVALMNFIGISLGYSIKDLTRRNFSRFLLCMWILSTFVIRNCYSARLFDLITIGVRFNLPRGFDDLLQMGYKLLMSKSTTSAVKTVSSISKLEMEDVAFSDEWEFVDFMLQRKEEYFKYAGVTPVEFIRLYIRYRGYEDEVYILPDIVYKQQLCIYFSKHSCLVERVDYLLLNLRSMGLISYWAKKSLRNKKKRRSTRDDVLDALDLHDMMGILYITFSGWILSGFAFICELCFGYFKPKKKIRPRRNVSLEYVGRWYNILGGNYAMSGEQIISQLLRTRKNGFQ